MDKVETIKFLAVMSAAYPSFTVTDERISVWSEIMFPIHFPLALNVLKEIMKTPREFAPSVGMVYDACVIKKSQMLDKLETAERLDRLRLMESIPQITPEELAEIDRKVRAGEYEEMFKDDPYLGKKVPIGD